MIYETEPEDFNSRFEVVGCFVEYKDEILLLHRQDHKPEGNTWGIPSGKIDAGETPLSTVIRELEEETGFKVSASNITYLRKLFIRFPSYDFVYHVFSTKLAKRMKAKINPTEHKDASWVTPEAAKGLNLIEDLEYGLVLFYGN